MHGEVLTSSHNRQAEVNIDCAGLQPHMHLPWVRTYRIGGPKARASWEGPHRDNRAMFLGFIGIFTYTHKNMILCENAAFVTSQCVYDLILKNDAEVNRRKWTELD